MSKYPSTQARKKPEARNPKAIDRSESKSERSNDGRGKPYDLEDRTAVFGENVIGFVRKIPVNAVTRRLTMTNRQHVPRQAAFGFRASGFLRAWVFRHSEFRAHRLG